MQKMLSLFLVLVKSIVTDLRIKGIVVDMKAGRAVSKSLNDKILFSLAVNRSWEKMPEYICFDDA